MAEDKKKKGGNLTRRDFIKVSGGVAAMAGVTAGGLLMSAGTAETASLPVVWDEAADVVIIGSGFAGLAAALETRNAGSSVVPTKQCRFENTAMFCFVNT